MEVAGLTIGAVALVSLFKDCVSLFSMITAARELGKDAAILDTKLDVEQMLFLQWSDRVGLLTHSTLLCNPDTRQIVSRVLESVKALLSEGQALQRDYGLKRIDTMFASGYAESTTGYQGVSSFRFAKFLRQFEELEMKPCQASDTDRHSNLNFKKVTKQFRWIIVDKDKFNSLIDHLSYFNTSLNNLIPISSASEATSSKNDLVHIKDLAELDLVIQWALDPPHDYLQWDDLNTWLQSASGLYWLSGKAGSGKSTLMKHDKTHALLETWANGSELIFARFFFYALGKSEQNVTEHALPHMWREACYSQSSPELEVPFIDQMATALKVLGSTLHAEKKIFLLIDGIDEYEGKDLDIARFISDLEFSPNVNILISSRPHPAFMTAFGQRPKMNLHDLTKRDLATYIQDTVASHPCVKSLSHQSRFPVDRITQKLARKASGVFLWVILACRSVVEGCDDFCTKTELEARVDELPTELEDLIDYMLENIDPRWKQDAMKLMHLAYTNIRPHSDTRPMLDTRKRVRGGYEPARDKLKTGHFVRNGSPMPGYGGPAKKSVLWPG
ncbi:small s protein [Fusarium agapanthi]|uniref:Small s protein n=1 Tax=Fusarium agapanthi TaxID=1803897 RepID=A0A9P5EAV3_9HYPO|nr:small s protein [Fusarium agapanthi]